MNVDIKSVREQSTEKRNAKCDPDLTAYITDAEANSDFRRMNGAHG